ncbi:extracellular solute-binding protein [Cryobacterium sp. PH31-L1]|uniref:sugar ABC transporter substrate-binding protein n=1 Tax=Cryobacterium sp. PH31-L1 TaxID=3046199 RepID=UPI0024B97246|nr:extracellular solute-binding protein [Cryobacterium sp. PH31-L1]MDJ0377471.1 extracellular solute-binding protein [Cryobacterium sp. PH31-L1]
MMKKTWVAATLAIGLAASLAGCSAGNGGDSTGGQKLTVMIGSSGDAETAAVEAATAAWAADNDATVEVVVASDLNQQLSQGFAGDAAPDLFYMGWDQFQTYASNGYLDPYADNLPNKDGFYPTLTDTFSYDGTFTCAPKDFSTLGLIINTDSWAAAGLTDADVPTDWDSLETVAKTLTTDTQVGLSFGLEYARAGAFMNQAGGHLVSDDGTTVDADSAENIAGLEYIQKLHTDGVLKFPTELDAGWSGEALGAGKAAMVIEGPWIKGIAADFPDTNYAAYELPAGPGGQSTFSFTNCWGIPQNSDTADAATSLVEFLTSDDQQLKAAAAFGVIPSTESAAATYAETYPENASFVASADYAVSPVNFAGSASAMTDFNSKLEGLIGGDPKAILESLQTSLQATLDEANAK